MHTIWQSWGVAAAVPLGVVTLAFSPVDAVALAAVSVSGVPVPMVAQGLYLRGTKIGSYTDDDTAFVQFANTVLANTFGGTVLTVDEGDDPYSGDEVEYAGDFWPFSYGGLGDITYGASVAQGVQRLGERIRRERNEEAANGTAPNDDTIVVYGYSQSAVIVGQYKASRQDPGIAYVLQSNPARPNGGILSRFQGFTIPILDIPLSGPTPTTSLGWNGEDVTTYDVSRQYDGWSDFPRYPQNLLADLNALAGMLYLHGSYEYEVPETAFAEDAVDTDVRRYGDTEYHTIGTDLLPMLRPLEQIGIPRPLLLALDAPLRVIVEKGYDRARSPGEMASAALRMPDPLGGLADVLRAVPVGIDDGLQASGLGRPLRTKAAGMYGVGGPIKPAPVDVGPAPSEQRSEQPGPTFRPDPVARRDGRRERSTDVAAAADRHTGPTRSGRDAESGVESARTTMTQHEAPPAGIEPAT
ncbi:PE-PPE domain-containing protein [Mycobacterium sp. WMMD1722]|uniref:PE-PPE domain-containing protein n=1 Tax=Mycobacterium sp. WMMD1722 TaxID=3404117 RepID=UPI003BF5B253